MTRKAFENAITVVIALGGSTNAVLHLLAIAHTARREAFDRRLHPHRQAGAGPRRPQALRQVRHGASCRASAACRRCMKMLLDAGLLHGDCLTVTGRTVAENLRGRGALPRRPGRRPAACRTRSRPTATCASSTATSRPSGAVAKITGKEGLRFSGRAIVFESEENALTAILDGRVKAGHVIVIRNEGPVGGPGMREMLAPTSAVMGKGLGKDVGAHHRRALLGRQPRLRRRPHHARGRGRRPDRRRRNGDPITIDAVANTISPRPRRQGDQGRAQGVAAHEAQGDARRAGEVRQARHQRLATGR